MRRTLGLKGLRRWNIWFWLNSYGYGMWAFILQFIWRSYWHFVSQSTVIALGCTPKWTATCSRLGRQDSGKFLSQLRMEWPSSCLQLSTRNCNVAFSPCVSWHRLGPFPIAVVIFSHVVFGNNFYLICYVTIPILEQVRIHDTRWLQSASKFKVIIIVFSTNLGGNPVSYRITFIFLFDSYLICYKTILIQFTLKMISIIKW